MCGNPCKGVPTAREPCGRRRRVASGGVSVPWPCAGYGMSNDGQQPSSSLPPGALRARGVQQALSDVLPQSLQSVAAHCIGLLISTIRAQRRQFTLRTCWLIWLSRSAAPEGTGRVSAQGSSRRACQYSGGRSGIRANPGFAAICFGVGMRQLAGRSLMPENKCRVRPKEARQKFGVGGVGTSRFGSS